MDLPSVWNVVALGLPGLAAFTCAVTKAPHPEAKAPQNAPAPGQK